MGYDLLDDHGYPITAAAYLRQERIKNAKARRKPMAPITEEEVKRLIGGKPPILIKPKN